MIDKINSAIGAFWGASFFVGVAVTIILGVRGNLHSDWFFAVVIGFLVFLILGLFIQGILTLFKR